MKLALFSPYGFFHREAGLAYLIANYLTKNGADGMQLRCDGAFSTCGRDRKLRWGRTLFSCARCTGEQRGLATWASLKSKDLSAFLVPDDVLQTARWISGVRSVDLMRIEFRGVHLWELCKDEVGARYPHASAGVLGGEEEQFLRALCITAVHALVAMDRFMATISPSLCLIVGAKDVLSNAYIAQAQQNGVESAVFSFDQSEEAIVVESLRSGARYSTRLILEGITAMRSDPRTWAPEVTAIVHEMLTFLGFAPDIVPT